MVIGGGDTAMEEANFLTRFGSEVVIVHRREEFLNTVVDDIYDVTQGIVTGVKLRNLVSGEVVDREVDGFLVAIGHIPNIQPFVGQIDLHADGYIISRGGARTIIKGVIHAGDVEDRIYRQAITAAGAGCKAAMECERFLEAHPH